MLNLIFFKAASKENINVPDPRNESIHNWVDLRYNDVSKSHHDTNTKHYIGTLVNIKVQDLILINL